MTQGGCRGGAATKSWPWLARPALAWPALARPALGRGGLAALVALALATASCAPPAPAPRGVVLIISDSLRADRLGFYGHARDTSPNLDSLAARSVVFDRAYSASSWTTPSVASLFTSLPPSVHRTGHARSRFGYRPELSPLPPTLASLLAERGFRTLGVLQNPAIAGSRGFDRGFERYENDEVVPPRGPTPPSDARVIELLEGVRDEPFLLVWHLIDPHWPYWPPAAHRAFVSAAPESVRFHEGFPTEAAAPLVRGELVLSEAEREHVLALYDGEVRFVDEQVGRVLAALDRLGLSERTALVFTADHGESFGEHGHYGHEVPLYEETLRIPLLVHDRRFAPRRVGEVVQAIDVMPTLLALSGVAATVKLQGRDLEPLLAGEDERWRSRPALAEAPQFVERKAWITREDKLVLGVGGQVLRDDYRPGQARRLSSEPFAKRYVLREGEARSPGPAAAGRIAELATQLEKRAQSNEAAQVPGASRFHSFAFVDEGWRRRAQAVQGEFLRRDGAIAPRAGASATWRIVAQAPATEVELHAVARCATPTRPFAISRDGATWQSLGWHVSDPPRFGRARLPAGLLAGASEVWVRFTGADAECALRGLTVEVFHTEAEHIAPDVVERLKALGYTE